MRVTYHTDYRGHEIEIVVSTPAEHSGGGRRSLWSGAVLGPRGIWMHGIEAYCWSEAVGVIYAAWLDHLVEL